MTTERVPQAEYPEHEKLQAVSAKSQIIGEFLEFVAGEWGWHLTVWGPTWYERLHWPQKPQRAWPDDDLEPSFTVLGPPESRRHILRHEYQQVEGSLNDQLARFFEIDLAVLEEEKVAMLTAIRRDHARNQ